MPKGKPRRPIKPTRARCDRWRGGYCMAWAESHEELLPCPRARALNAPPGECCHHPAFRVRNLLGVLERDGVDLSKWEGRLHDPVFVDKLYRAWRLKRSRSSSS